MKQAKALSYKQYKWLISIVIICYVCFITIVFGVYAICVNYARVSLFIDPDKTYQTMDGFGASMAWDVQLYGNDQEVTNNVARLLYSDDGMRLSIYRYNIGAGTKEIDNSYQFSERATESFFDSSKFVDMTSFGDANNYDFTKDSAAMNVFKTCLDTGNIKTLVLFANSPHYLMTKNHKGNGDESDKNNLAPENYATFSDYLLIIAQHFYNIIQTKNQTIKIYISPVNEPQWDWIINGQEGCHFEPAALAKFYDVFYTKLKAYNALHGTDFSLELFESGEYVHNYMAYINEFKKYDYYNEVDSVAFHSYGADDNEKINKMFGFYEGYILPNKNFHMSEWCEMEYGVDNSIGTGLYTARVIMQDLTHLSASMWCYWLGVSSHSYEDGLMYLGQNNGHPLTQSIRMSTMTQFSKFIDPTDVRIKFATADLFGISGIEGCAFKKLDGTITIVLINEKDHSRKVKAPRGYVIERGYFTDQNNSLALVNLDDITLAAKSITTLVCRPQ